jgi:hypothetical protein
MATTIIAKGHRTIAALKRKTTPWGGAAAVAASGDGIEIDSHSLKPNVALIQNDALGSAQRLPGAKGDELYAGEIGPCPTYYRGLELPLALAHGADTVSSLGSGAHKHVMKLVNDHEGKIATFLADVFGATADTPIWEYPDVKISGFRIEAEHNQMAKITFMGIPMKLNFNQGSPDADAIVVAVTPANGALILAGQPAKPTPLSILVVDANTSITELKATIVGTDADGNVITEVYLLSDDGLTFTTKNYYASVISATITDLAGVVTGDTIQIGVTNGANNAGTVGSISLPTDRNFVLFSQIESLLINAQGGGALVAADDDADNDEFYVSKVMLEVNLGMNEGDVTTRHRYWTEEPVTAGAEFFDITFGFNFSKYDTRNHEQLVKLISKGQQKAKLTFVGPLIGGAIPYSLTFYLNGLQIEGDAPVPGGPGIMPFDVTAKANRVTSVPTGFPGGYNDGVTTELVTTLATSPLA